ncbi:MAG: MaoC family dehydratase N-terminal domain-containing protein [Aggregatilineales bacterium]|nr:MaoC family dehydratase [Chloroflexota bacterium]HOA23382.1 MaoC family dehydratase N-terminal domain-containing protein [Aggregatilineales bacterium]HPV07030.1 MaoC family dehydratase N-terminal domain-containing protein [Aggregatilineales bacterium]
MLDPEVKGKVYEPFSMKIEAGKVREFLLATGDSNDAYREPDAPVPPTFGTVFRFWAGGGLEDALLQLGVDIRNVLHAEQEYEYLAPMHVGDTITGTTRISDVYTRAGMDFVEFTTQYMNQKGEPVLNERALIIVRG